MIVSLATTALAERLINSCGWVKGQEREEAVERLAREFQKAWFEEWQRLSSDERST